MLKKLLLKLLAFGAAAHTTPPVPWTAAPKLTLDGWRFTLAQSVLFHHGAGTAVMVGGPVLMIQKGRVVGLYAVTRRQRARVWVEGAMEN